MRKEAICGSGNEAWVSLVAFTAAAALTVVAVFRAD